MKSDLMHSLESHGVNPSSQNSVQDIFQRLHLLVGDGVAAAYGRLRIALFGVGGVGGWCAESLIRSGIGHLTIVDRDCVCASNVNRQLVATTETIGHPKVDVLRERLLGINPDADIVARRETYSAETSAAFDLGSFDYVLDAIDSLADKAHLIRAVTALERPVLFSSMGAARKMDPFRIRTSEFWAVQGDPLARALRTRFRKEGLFPAKKFMCVWSDEHLENLGEEAADAPGPRANGTIAHVTAMFGFALAGLVARDVYLRARMPPSV